MRQRKILLQVLGLSVAVVLTIASFEIAGLVYCMLFFDLDYAAAAEEKHRIYDLLPSLQVSGQEHLEEVRERSPSLTLNRPHQLHPYFGYVYGPSGRTTNNLGFPSEVDYPYRGGDDEFVVGLFGGSVAQQLGEDARSREILERRIAELARPHGVRSAKVILFAMSGWKQPQTFFAFSYFFQHLDMVIFLDGANEINQGQKLPWRGLYKHLIAQHLSQGAQIAIGEIAFRSRTLDRWTRSFSKPVLAHSMFAHALWRIRAYRELDQIRRLRLSLDDEDPASEYVGDVATTRGEYLDFFEQVSRWQALMSRDANKPYFHFLQPTKLLRESKPLSSAEVTEIELNPSHEQEMDHWTREFRRLEAMFERLRAEGIEAYSMTDIFHEVTETIYMDSVHLNDTGRVMLAKRMADTIQGLSAGSVWAGSSGGYRFLRAFDKLKVRANRAKGPVKIRSIEILGDRREALFAHPESEVVYEEVMVGGNARLKFSIGIDELAWDKPGDGVLFEIETLDEENNRRSVYARYIDPKSDIKDRRWIDQEVDCSSLAGKELTFIFRTSAGPDGNAYFDWAAWARLELISAPL